MTSPADLLSAYDEQLRTDAEATGSISATRLGPLLLVTFAGGRGFITYRDLGGVDGNGVRELVRGARAHFERQRDITCVEWKTRWHDYAPGLNDALKDHGFTAGEPEAIMIGEAHRLAVDVPLPDGVRLRQISEPDDVRAMCQMQGEVFDDEPAEIEAMADSAIQRLAGGEKLILWVAEAEGRVISAGRLQPVAGTDFAGIWGGSTRPEWRGRGIYRALTAARAHGALTLGKTLMHSDSTKFSRPILERSGLVKVSTTTPYEWRR